MFTRCNNNVGFILVSLAYLSIAQSINFGSLFDGLSFLNPFRSHDSFATAEHCAIFKKRRKCLLNTKNLKLDRSNRLHLVTSAGGRTIECNKKLSLGIDQWHGSCDGDADDANFITHFDKDGTRSVFGSIRIGEEICHIGPNIYGEEEILCIPKSDFQAEDDARIIPIQGNNDRFRILNSETTFGFVPIKDDNQSQDLLRGKYNPRNDRKLFDDSGNNIDIMVVWTKLAECSNAGLPSGCTVTESTENMIRGIIDLAIAETNTAFALSGIFTSLRLVHAYRDPNYVEGDDLYTSLTHITTPDDGYMDSVHRKRILYGADAVQLISGAANSCGIAWSGEPTVEYMFSVTQVSCATGYYSFGHELGHNFGMFHDQGTEKSCSVTTEFNYGYRNPNAEYRTMLSYDCKMGECDLMPKNGCPRIQRFSNSDSKYTYNGQPIGNTNCDNARQFNQFRSRVAAFFSAMNCQSDVECNDSNASTIDTCNVANGVCVFTPIDGTISPENVSPTQAPRTRIFSGFVSLFTRLLSWLGFRTSRL